MPQISKRVSPERRSEEEYCCRLSLCRAGSERSVSVLFVLLALIMRLSRENKQASISSSWDERDSFPDFRPRQKRTFRWGLSLEAS